MVRVTFQFGLVLGHNLTQAIQGITHQGVNLGLLRMGVIGIGRIA